MPLFDELSDPTVCARLRASGGGIRSALWRQILADVLDTEIETVSTEEGAAYGAALLALVGAGHYESPEAAAAKVVHTVPAAETTAMVETYRSIHERYRSLYPALRPVFQAGS